MLDQSYNLLVIFGIIESEVLRHQLFFSDLPHKQKDIPRDVLVL